MCARARERERDERAESVSEASKQRGAAAANLIDGAFRMQKPAVALEEVANHMHLQKLPEEKEKRPAKEPTEKCLEKVYGGHGMEEYLLDEVDLR